MVKVRFVGAQIPSSARVIVEVDSFTPFSSIVQQLNDQITAAGVVNDPVTIDAYLLVLLKQTAPATQPVAKGYVKWSSTPSANEMRDNTLLMLQKRQSMPLNDKELVASLQVIGDVIPKHPPFFLHVAKSATLESLFSKIEEKLKDDYHIHHVLVTPDMFSLVELDMTDPAKPEEQRVLNLQQTVSVAKLISNAVLLKEKVPPPVTPSGMITLTFTGDPIPRTALVQFEVPPTHNFKQIFDMLIAACNRQQLPSVAKYQMTYQNRTIASSAVASQFGSSTVSIELQLPPPSDYKIRVVGAPITKDARVFIMVNRARTTFAEMIPLIRAEAAKQDPPLLLSHEYDLVELDITDTKPTVKQQLNPNDTPDSAKMTQAVVMLKKQTPGNSRPPPSPSPSPSLFNRSVTPNTSTTSTAPTNAATDLKIRVVGGPVPKAARLFIDVSRARTTFADMLGLIRAEAAKLDPPVSLTDAFDLVELDMADGKPRPKQALMGGDTAESAKMTSPVVMLKPRAVQLSPLTASLRRGSYSHSGMVVVAPQDTERVAVVDMDATDLASMMSTDGEGVQEERFEWEWSPVTNAAAAQRASSLDPLQWSSRHLSLEPCPMMASEGSWSLPHSLDEADDEAAVWR